MHIQFSVKYKKKRRDVWIMVRQVIVQVNQNEKFTSVASDDMEVNKEWFVDGRTQVNTSVIIISKSNIHQRGVFAARDIAVGERIIEYVGDKISKKESTRRAEKVLKMASNNPELGAVYIFELDDRWDIDGNVEWNPARLINHSCSPNCEASNEEGHIWILALRDIKKDEELSYNYGYDLEHYHEHLCKCGSNNCVGFIVAEDEWVKLKKLINSKK